MFLAVVPEVTYIFCFLFFWKLPSWSIFVAHLRVIVVRVVLVLDVEYIHGLLICKTNRVMNEVDNW